MQMVIILIWRIIPGFWTVVESFVSFLEMLEGSWNISTGNTKDQLWCD